MSWATSFVTEPTAELEHRCTRCQGPIGAGDHYLREAVPPWAYEDWDPESQEVVRYSVGYWIVVKACHDCRG